MADRAISELIAASQVTPTDLFVLEQSGTAKKLTGQILENWLLSMADGHGGIHDISKVSTSGLTDTYRITLADSTTVDFTVTNGKAITSVKQTSTSGLTRTYTIAFNDGTSQKFTVTDGRSITSIQQTNTNGLTRTYTISMNDGTSETFTITDGRSVTEIKKTSTNKLTDTYTISYNDNTSTTFTVKNGRGIQSFEKVSTVGLVDTYRITYNDGTTNEFTVANGAKGDKGDNTYTWIRYASQEPTEASNSFGDVPDNWIGIYCGSSAEVPTDWKQYDWFEIKGGKGDTGDAATVVSSSVTYQVSEYGNIVPSGAWSNTIPSVSQGRYLWTRTVVTFNTGSPVTSYSVARMGMDGLGSVASVSDVSPDENGNVPLTAENVGALASSGGKMSGAIDMSGHPISGLQTPMNENEAANKGYVDGKVYALAETVAQLHGEAGAIIETASGEVITASDSSDKELKGLRIFGKTTQNGTPAPETPVSLESVGADGSVNVTVCGKNLLPCNLTPGNPFVNNGITYTMNADGSITANGTATAISNLKFLNPTGDDQIAVVPAGEYIMSVNGANSSLYFTCYDGIDVTGRRLDIKNANEYKVTLQSGYIYNARLVVLQGTTVNNITVYPMIRHASITDSTYEPYKKQTLSVSTPNALPGIPVSSGGNYTDENGQQWICDEVDFENGVYVQRIGKLVLDGSSDEPWYMGATTQDDKKRKYVHVEDKKVYDSSVKIQPMICDRYQISENGTSGNCYNCITSFSGVADSNRIYFYDDAVPGSDFTEWRNYLAEHPITVIYPLVEEKHIPLSDIDPNALTAYTALHTNYPNTTVFNDGGAGMEVKYVADTKLYIDKKFAELATAIVNNV